MNSNENNWTDTYKNAHDTEVADHYENSAERIGDDLILGYFDNLGNQDF